MMSALLPVLAVCYASASDITSMPSYMNAQDSSSSMEQLNYTGALALEADEAVSLAESKFTSLLTDVQEGVEGLSLYCGEVTWGANVAANASLREVGYMDLEAAVLPITTAVTAAGGTCAAGYSGVETCLHASVCMLEPEVEKSIPTHIYTVFVESTQTVPGLMADLPDAVPQEPSVLEKDCGSPSFLDEFSASSERQWNAVSIASLVEQASAAFQKADSLGPESFQNIWHSACAALKCDASSMLDIIHAVNGHAAELIAVKAPAALIRSYLIAIRKNEVSIKRMDGKMVERLSVVLTADSSNEHGTVRYDQTTKQAIGALSRARNLLLQQTAGFWDSFVNFWQSLFACFGFMITKAVAYGRTPIMFSVPCYCMGIVISLCAFVPVNWSLAGGKNVFLTSFKHLWEGMPFCLMCPLVFILSMCIGLVIAKPKVPGVGGSQGFAKKLITPFPNTNGWQNAQIRVGIALTISIGFKPVRTGENEGPFSDAEQASEEDFTEDEMALYDTHGTNGMDQAVCMNHVMLGISVGILGLVAVGYPDCVFGKTLPVFHIQFVCLKAWALSMTIICCQLNLTTGDNTCEGGGGCAKSPTGCALGRRRKRRQDIREHGWITAWEMRNGGKAWTGVAQVKRKIKCNQNKRRAGNCKSYWLRKWEAQQKINLIHQRRREWKQEIWEDQVEKQEKESKAEAEKAKDEIDKATGTSGSGVDPNAVEDCDANCQMLKCQEECYDESGESGECDNPECNECEDNCYDAYSGGTPYAAQVYQYVPYRSPYRSPYRPPSLASYSSPSWCDDERDCDEDPECC